MPARDADRVAPAEAAGHTRLGYPDEFNRVRWELEESFDPATNAAVPIPPDLRVTLLTTAQERRLTEAERAAYRDRKAARIAWARTHWMRVPAWGGRATPGGEYRYSAAQCRAWHRASTGGGG